MEMATLNEEILRRIRATLAHPWLFARSPEQANAEFVTLAAVALSMNSGLSLRDAFWRITKVLVPLAAHDVPSGRCQDVRLCDECVDPPQTSMEAFERHAAAFLKILEVEYGITCPEDNAQ